MLTMILRSVSSIDRMTFTYFLIQAQNLLLGIENKERIYLVDFGIACKYRWANF